jgi:hypothetical protein
MLRLLTTLAIFALSSPALAQDPPPVVAAPQLTPLDQALQFKLMQEINTGITCTQNYIQLQNEITELKKQLAELKKQ